jgi:predicted PhzF superfamily epimerase YddE/YHI9
LRVDREDGLYHLNFPSRPPESCSADPRLLAGLNLAPAAVLASPAAILASQDYFCIYESEDQVRSLQPDMARLAAIDRFAVIVTAPGTECDFVSRFFAPSKGIAEDPVTGRAHTSLIPYWSKRLGKQKLFARQVSQRGGELWCQDLGPRVRIGGRAVQYLEGRITIPLQ